MSKGKQLIEININEETVEEMLLEEIKKKVKEIENRHTFWDLQELSRQTCMSLGNIKDKFFYDPEFPKYKIGGKWVMPAKECEAFLLDWIKRQPKH